ncbi:MAG: hypothetical protein AAFN51_01155 [Pseudomonadota bacterium]
MNDNRLTGDEVRAFLLGRALDCFDPQSGERVATIRYLEDGTCHARMADGSTDEGRYGFEDDLYWTQYKWFRNGGLYRFFLVKVDAVTCQAWFDDGTKAFLQRISA